MSHATATATCAATVRGALALFLGMAGNALGAPQGDDRIFDSSLETLPCTGLACLRVQCPPGQATTPVTALGPTEKAVLYAMFDLQRCLGNDGD